MRVRELIERLSQSDPENLVYIDTGLYRPLCHLGLPDGRYAVFDGKDCVILNPGYEVDNDWSRKAYNGGD